MADDPKTAQSQPDPTESSPIEPRTTGVNPAETDSAEQAAGGQSQRSRTRHSRFTIAIDELKGLFGREDRHRRLHGRLIGILGLSLVVDLAFATVLTFVDSFSDKLDYSFGRAFAWTSSQMLVGGSSYQPQSGGGHVAEVLLQGYGVTVIAAIAGAFASFFQSGDIKPRLS
jgi:hypothetical protein